MIDNLSVSVIVTTYHPGRRDTLGMILDAWEKQPVDQVWLLNGGKPFEHKGKALVFNMPVDLGNGVDYSFAPLTEGDLVILADDDFLPRLGFTADLVREWQATGGIVGVIGRRFTSPVYRENGFFASCDVDRPEPVGFCGVCCMAPRALFGFDVRGMHRNCDDLWWQMRVFPEVPKHVVPTRAYQNLKCCNDGSAMFKQGPELQEARQKFFQEHYAATYATGRGFFDGR